jgi:hypothetical protein
VTAFNQLDALLGGACLQVFGEAADIRPMVKASYAMASADPGRPAKTVQGLFSQGPATSRLKGEGRGANFQGTTSFSSASAEFWLPAEQVATLGYDLVSGDRIGLPSRPQSPDYTITQIQHSDQGDLNLILVMESQP